MTKTVENFIQTTIKQDQIDKYLENGKDFINDDEIWKKIEENKNPEKSRIRDIMAKAYDIQTLTPDETAALINLKDESLWEDIYDLAGKIKRKVYDNRIVTFAPLYCSNLCVNNCLYCSFRYDNREKIAKRLSLDEVKKETEVLAGEIGHKRLIVVYGEHPLSDVDYIADTIETIYSVNVKTRKGYGQIRRVNINAAPMSVEDLKKLKEVGIGTYQVFQETYHHETYKKVHPQNTLKGNYRWRLYCHHRAMEAGVDDVAIGALFGLYDWRFEVMGLQYHTIELEKRFNGVGPHTISFPRLEPAANAPLAEHSKYKVSDEDFKKLVAIIRLSVPYTGMILTAREPAEIRREIIPIGITQTDASTKIGIGAYSDRYDKQEIEKQQFTLGDTRSLDIVVRELAEMGYITSFCTAGYRCGRTGEHIMGLLKCGAEGHMCKLNAILTFKEWLDDFASEETKKVGEKLLKKEIEEAKQKLPESYQKLVEFYKRTDNGERDLFF